MIIEPRVLKGFRDSLPKQELKKRDLIHSLEMKFRSFGFEPIDTPVLEYTEVLLGKGSGETDKQIYRFKDNGKRDVAMRFDLTVPFARYMAGHIHELYEPFKRYHIAKVWRGENTQRGRYREFFQCDFDIVGVDTLSADFEILLMMYQSLKGIGIEAFTIKVSHRGVFNAFLDRYDIQEKSTEILRIVDKLAKIGRENVISQLNELIDEKIALSILSFIEDKGSFKTTFENMVELSGGVTDASKRLSGIFDLIDSLGLQDFFMLDPSITRGLDYYTGIVYETILDANPTIGSVCSGGRYNELASLYTKKSLPGVGASIGLDRLLAALEDNEDKKSNERTVDVIVFDLDEELLSVYHRTAQELRTAGLRVEVFPKKKKLPQQFKFAERKDIPFGIFIGSDEAEKGVLTLRNLVERSEHKNITCSDAAEIINKKLEISCDKTP